MHFVVLFKQSLVLWKMHMTIFIQYMQQNSKLLSSFKNTLYQLLTSKSDFKIQHTELLLVYDINHFINKSNIIQYKCFRDVYNQILSILTSAGIERIFQNRMNFDIRNLMQSRKRLIDNLLNYRTNTCDWYTGNNRHLFIEKILKYFYFFYSFKNFICISNAISGNTSLKNTCPRYNNEYNSKVLF